MIINVQLRKVLAKPHYSIYDQERAILVTSCDHMHHLPWPCSPFLPSCVWGDPQTPGCLALVPGEGGEGRWEVVGREGSRGAVCKLLERGDGGCSAVDTSNSKSALLINITLVLPK